MNILLKVLKVIRDFMSKIFSKNSDTKNTNTNVAVGIGNNNGNGNIVFVGDSKINGNIITINNNTNEIDEHGLLNEHYEWMNKKEKIDFNKACNSWYHYKQYENNPLMKNGCFYKAKNRYFSIISQIKSKKHWIKEE